MTTMKIFVLKHEASQTCLTCAAHVTECILNMFDMNCCPHHCLKPCLKKIKNDFCWRMPAVTTSPMLDPLQVQEHASMLLSILLHSFVESGSQQDPDSPA